MFLFCYDKLLKVMNNKRDIYNKDITEKETIDIYTAYQNAVIDEKPIYMDENDVLFDNDSLYKLK